MKLPCIFLLMLLPICSQAQRVAHIGAQFGDELTSGTPFPNAQRVPVDSRLEVVQLSTPLVNITGTMTIRAPGAVLMQIMANGTAIWAGEVNCGDDWTPHTVTINVPIPISWSVTGPFYVNYQQYTACPHYPGAFMWEYQLTFYAI